MQITIDDTEIKEAINDFIAKQGIAITDKKLSISFTIGRGGNGNSATVDISEPTVNTTPCMPEDIITDIEDPVAIDSDHLFTEDE